MKRHTVLLFSLWAALACVAIAIEPEGLVYQSEKIAEPASAWIKDRSTPDHWNLWTKEAQIEKKRSGGAVLASPPVKADRSSPAEGAPPLHCTIRDLPPGWHQVFVSPPNRALGYSLDGANWFRREGGEFSLGLFHAGERPFELWVDDRYAGPKDSPGPAYFDYVRFLPATEPKIENLETNSPAPGVVVVCWTTNLPLSGAHAALEGGGKQQNTPPEENPLRNHRAVFRGLDAAASYRVQAVQETPLCRLASTPHTQRAAPQPPPTKRDLSIPLTVVEPSAQPRRQWPTVIGVPFPRAALANPADLRLATAAGQAVPLQAETFSRWSDGSVQWATLSFLADSARDAGAAYRLQSDGRPAEVKNLVKLAVASRGWTLQSPAATVQVDRAPGSLFRLSGDAAALRLIDGAGKAWVCGPPDDAGVTVESNGPIRAAVKWSGQLTLEGAAAATPEWGYLARLTFWKDCPLVDLDISLWRDALEPDFAAIRACTLSVPWARKSGAARGNAAPALPWAIQDRDNHCRYGDAGSPQERSKEHGDGFVHAASAAGELAVGLPDFWQTYPYGYRAQPAGVDLLLLPELPADAYRDADGRAWYWRIYSWRREGAYVMRAGQLIRRQVKLWLGPVEDPAALAQWLQQPLLPQAPPDYLCASGVLGRPLAPRSAQHRPDYETWFERSFAGLQENGRRNRTLGYMHYGDWYGERGLNYGNNEYDLPWALTVQWMRTGDAAYFWRGLAMARHYSSIDSVHGQPAAKVRGLCREHSFNHVGSPSSPDELFMPAADPRVKQYMDQYGGGMFRGAIDPQGHVFQDGNWISAAVSGDRFLRDEAARVCDHQATELTRKFDFGIERCGGWPLINAVGAYRHSGDPYYLNAARIMIERCLERQDPATGGWLHKPPLSETDGEAVLGGKAFAVGVLTFGILRYLEVEPRDRPDVRQMLVRGADWLMNEAWNPQKKGFRYISNCAKYRDTGSRGLTALMTLELAAAAHEWTHDDKYRRFAHDLLEGAFSGDCGKMGKDFAQGTRQTIFGLDRLRTAEQAIRAKP